MDRTPDVTSRRRPSSAAHRTRALAPGGALGAACLLVGCAGGGVVEPVPRTTAQQPGDGLPVVVHVVLEASCPRADPDLDDLTPFIVNGGRAQPRAGCVQEGLESVFTFDARVPGSSTVVVSPGGLRGVVVDAARASAAGEVTVTYAPDDGGFRPVTTAYGDGEDEPVLMS